MIGALLGGRESALIVRASGPVWDPKRRRNTLALGRRHYHPQDDRECARRRGQGRAHAHAVVQSLAAEARAETFRAAKRARRARE